MAQLAARAVGLRWRPPVGLGGRRTTFGIELAIVVAWVVLIAMLGSGTVHHGRAAARSPSGRVASTTSGMSGMSGMTGMTGMSGMTGMTGTSGRSGTSGMAGMAMVGAGGHGSMLLGDGAAAAIAMWGLMVVAMMLPAALPAVRHVAVNSLRWRRRRAVATFVAAYVSIWVGFGVLVLVLSPLWSSLDGAAVLALALALAAGWQLTVHKQRALRDCHRPRPLPPRGPRATMGVMRFALFNGLACLRSCWAMMLAMGVASSGMMFWMIAITGIVTTEKLAQKPRHAARTGAALLAAGAIVAGATAFIR